MALTLDQAHAELLDDLKELYATLSANHDPARNLYLLNVNREAARERVYELLQHRPEVAGFIATLTANLGPEEIKLRVINQLLDPENPITIASAAEADAVGKELGVRSVNEPLIEIPGVLPIIFIARLIGAGHTDELLIQLVESEKNNIRLEFEPGHIKTLGMELHEKYPDDFPEVEPPKPPAKLKPASATPAAKLAATGAKARGRVALDPTQKILVDICQAANPITMGTTKTGLLKYPRSFEPAKQKAEIYAMHGIFAPHGLDLKAVVDKPGEYSFGAGNKLKIEAANTIGGKPGATKFFAEFTLTEDMMIALAVTAGRNIASKLTPEAAARYTAASKGVGEGRK